MSTGLVAVLLLIPSLAFGASFANQSIFLSRADVAEGQTVLVHVVVRNDASIAFTGTLALTDNGAALSTTPVVLAAGAADTVSVSWTPKAGSHTIAAQLQPQGGGPTETDSETFVIKSAPAPAAPAEEPGSAGSASVQSSQSLRESIASFSPQTEMVLRPAFRAIDDGRSKAAGALDNQIATTKQKLDTTPKPIAEGSALPNPTNSFWFVLWTLYFYLLTILRFILNSAGIFYPVLAVAFLYFLWKLFRHFTKPAY